MKTLILQYQLTKCTKKIIKWAKRVLLKKGLHFLIQSIINKSFNQSTGYISLGIKKGMQLLFYRSIFYKSTVTKKTYFESKLGTCYCIHYCLNGIYLHGVITSKEQTKSVQLKNTFIDIFNACIQYYFSSFTVGQLT